VGNQFESSGLESNNIQWLISSYLIQSTSYTGWAKDHFLKKKRSYRIQPSVAKYKQHLTGRETQKFRLKGLCPVILNCRERIYHVVAEFYITATVRRCDCRSIFWLRHGF
jgi:hypothetical protein